LTENVILSLQPVYSVQEQSKGLQVKAYANFSDFAGNLDHAGF